MQDIEQRLNRLNQQLSSGEITQEIYERIKKNLEVKKEAIESLSQDYHNHKISAEEYSKKIYEIQMTEEFQFDDFKRGQAKKKTKRTLIILMVVFGLIFAHFAGKEIKRICIKYNNIETIDSLKNIPEPAQSAIVKTKITTKTQDGDVDIELLAEYSISGRIFDAVNHKYKFTSDIYSELSPVDLAIGWGVVANDAKKLKINSVQTRMIKTECLDQAWCDQVGWETINTNSSNTHFIPANDEIRSKLISAREGDYVKIDGYLVGVYSDYAQPWVSSLERNDHHQQGWLAQGLGLENNAAYACEIMYVTDMKWLSER